MDSSGHLKRGLREPLGSVETMVTDPEVVIEINAGFWVPLVDIEALERIHLIGLARRLTYDRQLVRVSTEGYMLEVYGYDEHGNVALVDTQYVHQGEVSEYYEQITPVTSEYFIVWPYVERDVGPRKWHRVR